MRLEVAVQRGTLVHELDRLCDVECGEEGTASLVDAAALLPRDFMCQSLGSGLTWRDEVIFQSSCSTRPWFPDCHCNANSHQLGSFTPER